jgi:uncharacterized paraquat-inducible protein A
LEDKQAAPRAIEDGEDDAPRPGSSQDGSQRRARACLTCQSRFESEWYGERICKRCKSRAGMRQGKR